MHHVNPGGFAILQGKYCVHKLHQGNGLGKVTRCRLVGERSLDVPVHISIVGLCLLAMVLPFSIVHKDRGNGICRDRARLWFATAASETVDGGPGLPAGVSEINGVDCFFPPDSSFVSNDVEKDLALFCLLQVAGSILFCKGCLTFIIPTWDVLATPSTWDG